jgi:hypothetical protein
MRFKTLKYHFKASKKETSMLNLLCMLAPIGTFTLT